MSRTTRLALVLLLGLTWGGAGCANRSGVGEVFRSRPQAEALALEPREAPRRPAALDFYRVELADEAAAAGVAISARVAPTSSLDVVGVRVELGEQSVELSPVPREGAPLGVFWLSPGSHRATLWVAYHLVSEPEGKLEVRKGYLPDLDLRPGGRVRVDLEIGEDVLQRVPTPKLTLGARMWVVEGTQWREVGVRPHNTDAPTDLEDLVKEKDEE